MGKLTRGMEDRKILFVIPGLNAGGTEMALLRLCEGLVDAGWQVRVATLGYPRALEKRFQEKGVRVHGAWLESSLRWIPGQLGEGVRSLLGIFNLVPILWKWRPSLVHSFLPLGVISGGLGCRLSGLRVPMIASRRSLRDYQKNHRILTGLEHGMMESSAALTGNSQAVANQLREEGFPEEFVFQIYNGCPGVNDAAPGTREQHRRAEGIEDDEVVLVIVANLFTYKGHRDLIHALGILDRDGNGRTPWRLYCLGRDEGILKELEELASDQGLAGRVHWLGPVKDPGTYLELADIALLVSHQEGFSNAILEAMAHGLPLIASDVGGNAEAVIHGETGVLFPPEDTGALAEAIRFLIDSPEIRQSMGERGRERQREFFSLERCLEEHLDLYSSIVDRSGDG